MDKPRHPRHFQDLRVAVVANDWCITFTYPGVFHGFTAHSHSILLMIETCRAYIRALQKERSISPLLPGPRVAGAANDWCINVSHIAWGCRRQLGSEVQSRTKNMKGGAHFSLFTASFFPHSKRNPSLLLC